MKNQIFGNTKYKVFAVYALLILASFSLAVLFTFLFPGQTGYWNNKITDSFFKIRYVLSGCEEISPYIENLAIDDSVREKYNLTYLDRHIYADMISGLSSYRPKVTGLDILFKEKLLFPGLNERDEELVKAVGKCTPVILPVIGQKIPLDNGNPEPYPSLTIYPVIVHKGKPPEINTLITPFNELLSYAEGTGCISITPDADGITRKYPLLYKHEDGYIFSFPLSIVCSFYHVNPLDVEICFGKNITLRNVQIIPGLQEDLIIPIDREGNIIINYPGPWEDTVKPIRANQVLESMENRELKNTLYTKLSDKIVLFSDISTAEKDYAVSIFESVYPTNGILFTVINSIVTQNYLYPPPIPVSVEAIILLCIVLFAGITRFRPLFFCIYSALLFFLYFISTIVLFTVFHRMTFILMHSTGYMLAALSVFLYKAFLTEKEKAANEAIYKESKKVIKLNEFLKTSNRELDIANIQLKKKDALKNAFLDNIRQELTGMLYVITESIKTLLKIHQQELPDFFTTFLNRTSMLLKKITDYVYNLKSEEKRKNMLNDDKPITDKALPGSLPKKSELEKTGTIYTHGTYPHHPVLIIDTDTGILDKCRNSLESEGIDNIILCTDVQKQEEILKSSQISVLIIDIFKTDESVGMKLFYSIKEENPGLPAVVMTGIEHAGTALKCLKAGAFDYMIKPIETNRLITSVNHILEMSRLEKEVESLGKGIREKQLNNPELFSGIITNNSEMLSIFAYIEAIAETPMPVLITGETGTGKELIARVIHNASRRPGSFVVVNIAGLDDTLFSDTLFGHRKGAFTGATTDRRGLIGQANGGTLFLDEIGDLSLQSQVKLLRLIQQGEYYPLGSDDQHISDARIITATNINLENGRDESKFRKDLYYRLLSHHIHLPSLRDRGEDDLLILTHHLLQNACAVMNKEIPAIPEELYLLLETYTFPGNVRELEELLKNAVSIMKNNIFPVSQVKEYILKHSPGTEVSEKRKGNILSIKTRDGEFPRIPEVKKYLVKRALKITKGNQSAAAKLLGIAQSTLSRQGK